MSGLPSGLYGGADPGVRGGLLIGSPYVFMLGSRPRLGLKVRWMLPFNVPTGRGLKTRSAWDQVRQQLRACPLLGEVKVWSLELPQQGAGPGENRGRLLEMLEAAIPVRSRIEDADPSPHGWPRQGRFHGAGSPKAESRQTAEIAGDWSEVVGSRSGGSEAHGPPDHDGIWDAFCLARVSALLQVGSEDRLLQSFGPAST
jgi:hypothetical protein